MKEENKARAKGLNLSISHKFAIEICSFIRGKSVPKMRRYLAEVLELKKPIPFKFYKMDLPHQKSRQGPGRYPINAVRAVLGVLNSAVSNAEDRGMRAEDLFIEAAIANKGPSTWRYGRQARRKAKRAHVEIVVKEKETAKREAKKPEAKSESKQAAEKNGQKPEKKEEVKEQPKKVEKKEEKPKSKSESKQTTGKKQEKEHPKKVEKKEEKAEKKQGEKKE